VWVSELFDDHPAPQYDCGLGTVFFVRVAGPGPHAYQWRLNGVVLADGTQASGAVVTGAKTSRLAIMNAGTADEGSYDCVVSLACGSMVSNPAPLTVCTVDMNCDGVVDFGDYLEFLRVFDTESLRADFTGDGIVDFADFLAFISAFDAGC
jgi:hypothetical protein